MPNMPRTIQASSRFRPFVTINLSSIRRSEDRMRWLSLPVFVRRTHGHPDSLHTFFMAHPYCTLMTHNTRECNQQAPCCKTVASNMRPHRLIDFAPSRNRQTCGRTAAAGEYDPGCPKHPWLRSPVMPDGATEEYNGRWRSAIPQACDALDVAANLNPGLSRPADTGITRRPPIGSSSHLFAYTRKPTPFIRDH